MFAFFISRKRRERALLADELPRAHRVGGALVARRVLAAARRRVHPREDLDARRVVQRLLADAAEQRQLARRAVDAREVLARLRRQWIVPQVGVEAEEAITPAT